MRSDEELTRTLLQPMLDIGEQAVADLIDDLKKENRTLKVSDIEDAAGHQYVNLVQQGGGVLGIALLGYTYVLERMGVRFLKLAGTSAGAINSAMMAVVNPPEPEIPPADPNDPSQLRSPIILYYLAQKNLFDFVDGQPIARWLIDCTIRLQDFPARLFRSVLLTLVVAVGLLVLSGPLLWADAGAGIVGLLSGLVVAYVVALIVFKPGFISNGAIQTYLLGNYFLWRFVAILAALGLLYAIMSIPDSCQYQSLFGLGVLGVLTLYVSLKTFSQRYTPFIQICAGAILLLVLINGIVNSLHYVWVLRWPVLFYAPANKPMPDRYLSIAGMALLLFLVLVVISVGLYLVGRFNGSDYGINPGKEFRRWMAGLMAEGAVPNPDGSDAPYKETQAHKPLGITLKSGKIISILNSRNGVTTLASLDAKLAATIPADLRYAPAENGLTIFDDNPTDDPMAGLKEYDPTEPTLSLVTTEIATENKIVFPKMWTLFYDKGARDDARKLSPADFVRASMSIPAFFEPFRVEGVPARKGDVLQQREWAKYVRYDEDSPDITEAVFVDGGALSNFPINLFEPPRSGVPRLPVFGARLQDQAPADSRLTNSLTGIAGSILSTMRSYYDKDFLIAHPHYEQGLADINVQEFNWLDFNLKPETQVALFKRGADEARRFLYRFDWERYKVEKKALNLGVPIADVRMAGTMDGLWNLIKATEASRNMYKPDSAS